MQLPVPFKDNILKQLGIDEVTEFYYSLEKEIPVSIRINPHKTNDDQTENNVPWCTLGHYLKERPVFTLDPAFHAGAYYVQEASSMFIWHILSHLCDEKKDIRVLDLSAAPGGKSTLIASFLDKKGLLVANEIIKNRAYTLKYNLSKEGYSNVVVTNNEPKDFSELLGFFDMILVDAPCSGEGMFRKDPNAILEWSVENVKSCSIRQQKILSEIIPTLKEGGHLIYSTCTYNDQENIDNVWYASKEFGLETVNIPNEATWQITTIQKENTVGYQFYPHKTKGEGFFVSVLQKGASSIKYPRWKSNEKVLIPLDKKYNQIITPWMKPGNFDLLSDKTGNIHLFPAESTESAKILSQYLRIIYCGTTIGMLNKAILIPDHSLALSLNRSDNVAVVDLSKDEALLFLKKELNTIDSPNKSWILATYNGLGIGWLKNLGNRINNYLPSEYRILMKIK